MLRRVIWSMISLLFIAYVGENAGLSLVGPAFAQTGSGSGSQTTATVGSCPVWLEGDNSAVYIADNYNVSGGVFESGGSFIGGSSIIASDFSTCNVSNLSIKSQSGPSSGNI